MSFTEMALRMHPYWLMGLLMILVTYRSSHRELLRVELKPVLKWLVVLGVLTAYRALLFHFFETNQTLHNMTQAVTIIPWQSTLTVFWEDACHGLPLAILARSLGNDKWWKKALIGLAILLVMVSFGMGHAYQGTAAMILLSFYIPFSFVRGQKWGFGTMMICHTLYDLATILTIKAFL